MPLLSVWVGLLFRGKKKEKKKGADADAGDSTADDDYFARRAAVAVAKERSLGEPCSHDDCIAVVSVYTAVPHAPRRSYSFRGLKHSKWR